MFTILIGSIGLAVDNPVHFIYHFRKIGDNDRLFCERRYAI